MTGAAAVLFDLDGVLADSHQAMRQALAGFATSCLGTRVVPADLPAEAAVTSRDTVLAGLGVQGPFNEAAWDAASATATLSATVFPYVPGTLTALRAAGLATGIVTTRSRRRVPWLLDGTLSALFDVIVCNDDAPLKPAPDGILLALEQLDVEPAHTVFIGDSVTDIEAGLAAKVTTFAVSWGCTPPSLLQEAGAHQTLATTGDLLTAVLRLAESWQTDGKRS